MQAALRPAPIHMRTLLTLTDMEAAGKATLPPSTIAQA